MENVLLLIQPKSGVCMGGEEEKMPPCPLVPPAQLSIKAWPSMKVLGDL